MQWTLTFLSQRIGERLWGHLAYTLRVDAPSDVLSSDLMFWEKFLMSDVLATKSDVEWTAVFAFHITSPWTSAENFPGGGQSWHFAYPFQVVDDATQMDVHKTLHPFYTTKKNAQCYGNSCKQCFPSKKILIMANVFSSEHGYFKTELSEF